MRSTVPPSQDERSAHAVPSQWNGARAALKSLSVTERARKVSDLLHDLGRDLPPEKWRDLLEEIQADIDGFLDAHREENA